MNKKELMADMQKRLREYMTEEELDESITNLVKKGLIEYEGIDDDGNLVPQLTELGELVAMEMLKSDEK